MPDNDPNPDAPETKPLGKMSKDELAEHARNLEDELATTREAAETALEAVAAAKADAAKAAKARDELRSRHNELVAEHAAAADRIKAMEADPPSLDGAAVVTARKRLVPREGVVYEKGEPIATIAVAPGITIPYLAGALSRAMAKAADPEPTPALPGPKA